MKKIYFNINFNGFACGKQMKSPTIFLTFATQQQQQRQHKLNNI